MITIAKTAKIKDVLKSANTVSIKSKTVRIITTLFLYALLIGVVYVFIFPFIYMIITSIKTSKDLSDVSVNWIPTSVKLDNFRIAVNSIKYFTGLQITAVITILSTVGHLFSCSMAGYAFARYKFKGHNLLFFIVLLSIIIPIQSLIIPLYMMFANFKMINSVFPLILPTFFGMGLRGGLFIFIFRQFFLGLPKEIEEAAEIDGCSFLKVFFTIVIPIAKPTLLVAGVLSTVWHWNASYEASIYISKDILKPLATRIDLIVNYVNNPPLDIFEDISSSAGEQVINVAVLMAGCFLILLPLMIMFGILQRFFMEGVERSGLVE